MIRSPDSEVIGPVTVAGNYLSRFKSWRPGASIVVVFVLFCLICYGV